MNATHPLGLAAAGLDVNHPCFTEDDLDLIFDQIPSDTAFSYTVFTKTGGPLTKRHQPDTGRRDSTRMAAPAS